VLQLARRAPLRSLVALAAFAAPAAAGEAAPRVLGRIPSALESRLQTAFDLARERLASRPACRELYRGLDRSGARSLLATRYLPTTLRERRRVCSRRVSAFTVTGGLATRLCPSFARLATPRAAVVLIHEALHSAGLPEAPQTPGALRSSEINELVARRCEL